MCASLSRLVRDLAESVEQGRFRNDLYYRLNILPFDVPPLRERRDDIVPLLEFHLQSLSAKYQLDAPAFTDAAKKRLADYDWPGNVRELKNFCERMQILCAGQTLGVSNLPSELRRPTQRASGLKAFCVAGRGPVAGRAGSIDDQPGPG